MTSPQCGALLMLVILAGGRAVVAQSTLTGGLPRRAPPVTSRTPGGQ